MTDTYLRIAALYERDECRKIDGAWHIPLSALGAVLAEHGFRIVEDFAAGGHGDAGEPRTASDGAHETATSSVLSNIVAIVREWADDREMSKGRAFDEIRRALRYSGRLEEAL